MEQTEIQTTVKKILDESNTGTMATIRNNKPNSRYMTFFHDGLKLYTPTFPDTDKVEDIEQNPYAHILIGYAGDGFGDLYLDYMGKVSINDSAEVKEKLWNDETKRYFDNPEDPNYIVLEIEPVEAYLMNKKGEEPQKLEL